MDAPNRIILNRDNNGNWSAFFVDPDPFGGDALEAPLSCFPGDLLVDIEEAAAMHEVSAINPPYAPDPSFATAVRHMLFLKEEE